MLGLVATSLAYGIVAIARGIAKKAGYDLTKSQAAALSAAVKEAIMWMAEKSAL